MAVDLGTETTVVGVALEKKINDGLGILKFWAESEDSVKGSRGTGPKFIMQERERMQALAVPSESDDAAKSCM